MNITRGGLTATIAAGLISVGGMAAAAPVTLDFSGNICNGGNACNNSNLIDQSYGDIVGELDVQWDRSPVLDGPNNMSWWGTSYGDLQGVAFGDPNPSASFAISFVAAPGFGVALHSFDIAAWSPSNSRVVVVDLAGGAELFDSGVIEVPNTGHMSFLDPGGPDAWMSSVGLQLLVGPDGYNVGIDNITYSTFDATVVPLPPAGLLLLTGVAAALGVLRRRRR